jgi:hypothetical protein
LRDGIENVIVRLNQRDIAGAIDIL